jgi:hypothetical protein
MTTLQRSGDTGNNNTVKFQHSLFPGRECL